MAALPRTDRVPAQPPRPAIVTNTKENVLKQVLHLLLNVPGAANDDAIFWHHGANVPNTITLAQYVHNWRSLRNNFVNMSFNNDTVKLLGRTYYTIVVQHKTDVVSNDTLLLFCDNSKIVSGFVYFFKEEATRDLAFAVLADHAAEAAFLATEDGE